MPFVGSASLSNDCTKIANFFTLSSSTLSLLTPKRSVGKTLPSSFMLDVSRSANFSFPILKVIFFVLFLKVKYPSSSVTPTISSAI